MSSTVACSRMTWLVIGSLRAFTTSASSRSTRYWISTLPSRSANIVLEQQDGLFADLLAPRDPQARRDRRKVLPEGARHEDPVGRRSRPAAGRDDEAAALRFARDDPH